MTASTTALPDTDLDLAGADFVADPYPALAGLRRLGPLVRHRATGLLLATTHAAVSETLRHRGLGRVWQDREPAETFAPFNALHRHQMMENEPPVHTRLRRLVAAAFARGHVERMRPRVQRIADDLLSRLAPDADGRVDLVAGYAESLPVAVIADLLGVPERDRGLLRDWSQAIVRMYEYDRSPALEAAAVRASAEFAGYVRDLVDRRRRVPGPDLLTDLVHVSDTGQEALSEDELVASAVLLLNAGHEASVNAFGNGLVALLRHPAELARVTAGAVPVEEALEELLRHDAPLQLFERTATADVSLGGAVVAAGTKVAALLGAANRDPAVFPDPDRLDLARTPNPHLGFGLGVHFCLGAPLARMELAVSLDRLLTHHPRLRLAGEPTRRDTFVLRGYAAIPVELGSTP